MIALRKGQRSNFKLVFFRVKVIGYKLLFNLFIYFSLSFFKHSEMHLIFYSMQLTYFFIYPFITSRLFAFISSFTHLSVYLVTFLSTFSHLPIYLCIYLGYLCAYLYTLYSFISRFIFLISEIIHVFMFMSVHFFFSLFFYSLNLSVQVYVWLSYEF